VDLGGAVDGRDVEADTRGLVQARQRGVSGLDAAPSNLNTGSSRAVYGCTSNLFSQSAADDFDGSKPAGSESEPLTRGCQLEATSKVGTITSRPDLKMGEALHLRFLERSGNTYTRCGPSSGLGAAEWLLQTNNEPRCPRMRPPPSLENVLKLSRTQSMASPKPRICLPRRWKEG